MRMICITIHLVGNKSYVFLQFHDEIELTTNHALHLVGSTFMCTCINDCMQLRTLSIHIMLLYLANWLMFCMVCVTTKITYNAHLHILTPMVIVLVVDEGKMTTHGGFTFSISIPFLTGLFLPSELSLEFVSEWDSISDIVSTEHHKQVNFRVSTISPYAFHPNESHIHRICIWSRC